MEVSEYPTPSYITEPVTKAAWSQHKNRYIDQVNKIDDKNRMELYTWFLTNIPKIYISKNHLQQMVLQTLAIDM